MVERDVPAEDMRRAIDAVKAMVDGNRMGFMRPWIEGRDQDWAAGNDARRSGFVWALAQLATDAVVEIDRRAGSGEGSRWLQQRAVELPTE
jgi:hypothetical protein